MFVFVTEKETGQSIAVNVNNVAYMRDFPMGPKIVFIDGTYLVVGDNYLHLYNSFNTQSNSCC